TPKQQAAAPAIAWETGPPPKGWDDTSVPITPDRMVELAEDKEPQARVLLEKSAIVALTPTLYLDLLPGKGYPADKNKQPFLVRGVVVGGIDGGFNGEQKGDELWVIYAGRGNAGAKTAKPLVFLLPAQPRKLFVSTLVNNF